MKLENLSPTDEAVAGKWFDYIDPRTGKTVENLDASGKVISVVALKIATADQEVFKMKMSNGVRKITNKRIGGSRKKNVLPTYEEQVEIEIQALAEHVLVDFSGIELDGNTPLNGKTLKNRVLVLESMYIREFVTMIADDAERFAEAELGN